MTLFNEIKEVPTGKKDIQKFAFLVGGIVMLLGALSFAYEKESAASMFFMGVVLVIIGWLVPELLKQVYIAWMAVAVLLGWVTTRIILGIIYYGIITPIGFFGRAAGKSFLDVSNQLSLSSFWNAREEKIDKSNHERQF